MGSLLKGRFYWPREVRPGRRFLVLGCAAQRTSSRLLAWGEKKRMWPSYSYSAFGGTRTPTRYGSGLTRAGVTKGRRSFFLVIGGRAFSLPNFRSHGMNPRGPCDQGVTSQNFEWRQIIGASCLGRRNVGFCPRLSRFRLLLTQPAG